MVGVFAYTNKDIQRFLAQGYRTSEVVEVADEIVNDDERVKSTLQNYKDLFYPEFRGIALDGTMRDLAMKALSRKKVFDFQLAMKDGVMLPVQVNEQELMLFKGGIGIFSVTFSLLEPTVTYVSNLTFNARSFQTRVDDAKVGVFMSQWISSNVLCGIPLTGGRKVEVDRYSGSKFRFYTIIDIAEDPAIPFDRNELMYEIGTCSRIGTMQLNNHSTPSESYYNELLSDKLDVFRNYSGLALLDSFTVVGEKNYFPVSAQGHYSHHSWNRSYFRIYVFNLFMKYNLFRFNSRFLNDPVKYRDEFERFLNYYNFKQISFNFLPALIFEKMRRALGIDGEIEQFRDRLSSLATAIQEQQEKRQAALLTIISLVSSISAVKPIFDTVVAVKEWLGWSTPIFISAASAFALLVLFLGLVILFPLHYKKLKKFIHDVRDVHPE
jgi:hypothetical protein